MTSVSSLLKPLALAALLAGSAAARASFTIYTSESSFLAALSGSTVGVDSFDDLVPGASLGAGPLLRNAGTISYSVSAGPSSDVLYGAGTASDAWLSTNVATDSLSFSGFAPGVYAAGANLFGSDVSGAYLRRGSVTITAFSGADSATKTRRFAPITTFFGFVSDTPLTALTVSATSGARATVWPTVNNLTLATTAVPEPGTYAMLLGGLAFVGFLARRRQG